MSEREKEILLRKNTIVVKVLYLRICLIGISSILLVTLYIILRANCCNSLAIKIYLIAELLEIFQKREINTRFFENNSVYLKR